MSLKNYIQGKRQGKNANQLEREALNDPFLQDAIDGFDSIQGEHLPVIEELERQVVRKTTKKSRHYRIWILSAAASLALLLGVTIFMRNNEGTEPQIAKQKLENQIDSLKQLAVAKDTFVDEKQLAVVKENPDVKSTLLEKKAVDKTQETHQSFTDEIKLELSTKPESISSALIAETVQVETKQSDIAEVKQEEPVIRIRGAASLLPTKPATKSELIFGVVLDETNNPIVGANVKYNNGYAGTITDINGRFTLPAPKDKSDKLITSYIGYEKSVMSLPGDSAIIRLKPDNLALSEVEVVGYGVRKNIFSKSKTEQTTDEVLAGRLAGIDVQQTKKTKIFDEQEFKKYFEKNRNLNICAGKPASIMVGFYIDESGKATNVQVINCDCAELEAEFKRLIKNCPLWTKRNRDLILTLRLK